MFPFKRKPKFLIFALKSYFMATKNRHLLIRYFAIIFFSGLAFLVLEVSWFRILSLVIGSTTGASAVVLSAYLLGLGIGAHYFGRNRLWISTSVLYLLIALMAMATYYATLFGIPILYRQVGLGNPLLMGIIGYAVASALIFIPSFFMGGVFPLFAQKVSPLTDNKEKTLGLLYALETFGSVLGGLLAAFFLIKIFGQLYTVIVAAALLLLVSVVLYFERTKRGQQIPEKQAFAKIKKLSSEEKLKWKMVLASTFVCGFMVVAMQTIWFRFFKVYFVNTSYTFAMVSTMVIFGLYLGSWLYSSMARRIKDKTRTLFRIMIWMAAVATVGMFVIVNLPSLVLIPMAVSQDDYLVRILIIPIVSALLIIVPLTLLSGFCLPLLWSMVVSDNQQVAAQTGRVLFFNALGSVSGPLLATFLFVPMVGGALASVFPIVLVIVTALWIASQIGDKKKVPMFRFAMIASATIGLLLLILAPKIYILPPSFNKYDKEILGYGETSEGTFIVGRDKNVENPVISTYNNNSSVIGSTYDAIKAVKMVGHLPFLMGLECNRVLVVGFGIGVTTSAIASHPQVQQIDCVELMPELKNVAHYYKDINREVYLDPRLKMFGDDGRHFLQATNRQYDLISSDPTHPILGSGSIYTKEYFELCKAHLTDRGMISQYLPLHKLRLSDFLGIIKTFKSVFPDATIWIGQYHAILIASKQGNTLPIDFKRWKTETENLTPDPYFYNNPYHLASCMLLDEQQIDEITSDAVINTDDKSYVEFFSFDAFAADNLPNNLAYLNEHRGGVTRAFVNVEDPQLLSKFIFGNQIHTEGIISMLRNNMGAYKIALEKAIQENPENQEFPFLLKLNFSR